MKNIALITARGGSKGIPRKNILPFAGKPLIHWTIEAAKKSKYIDLIFVSTDDQEIAEVSRKAGAFVPFLRPSYLANDFSPSIDTVIHTLNEFNNFDYIFLLQPTSPLRTNLDLDKSMELLIKSNSESLVSLSESQKHPALNFYINEDDKRIKQITNIPVPSQRQETQVSYTLNGAIYLSSTSSVMAKKTFLRESTIGYIMPIERSVDIDTQLDWEWGEFLAKRNLKIISSS